MLKKFLILSDYDDGFFLYPSHFIQGIKIGREVRYSTDWGASPWIEKPNRGGQEICSHFHERDCFFLQYLLAISIWPLWFRTGQSRGDRTVQTLSRKVKL